MQQNFKDNVSNDDLLEKQYTIENVTSEIPLGEERFLSEDTKKLEYENDVNTKNTLILEKPSLQKRPISRHESLREFLVMTDEKGDKVTLEDNGLNSVISKDESELTDEERMLLYEKAMSFKGLGSSNHALLCFLGCLKGLKPSSKSTFTMLPQCLTHISEIYASAGDYQRAVEFMQGTKLYYETAIIEAGMQVDEYKEKSGEEYRPIDFDPCLDEAKRANEYERLANSCLEQRKFQLALEYCGKATKLRQAAYGDQHPLTVKSLDLFTLIYAEMGKSQYSEAMSKVGDIVKSFKAERQAKDLENNQENLVNEKACDEDEKIEKEQSKESMKLTSSDDAQTQDGTEHDERHEDRNDEVDKNHELESIHHDIKETSSLRSFTLLQVVMFVLCSALLAVAMTTMCCYVSESPSCPTRDYLYTKLKFLYYFYIVPSDPDTNYA